MIDIDLGPLEHGPHANLIGEMASALRMATFKRSGWVAALLLVLVTHIAMLTSVLRSNLDKSRDGQALTGNTICPFVHAVVS